MTVVILLADGARPDTLRAAIDGGRLPALARLKEEGALLEVTSCFPSVTGPAYTPFLMGRFPGPVGLPGLRWFDRARTACTFPDYTRSYVGPQMNRVDTDLDADAPTAFEICEPSLGSFTPLSRGLSRHNKIGQLSLRTAIRAARTHFGGQAAKWLDVDREMADEVVAHIRREKPEFVFAALVGIDKTSHSMGQPSPLTDEALVIVDETAARIRADAERDGRWKDMHVWITSDHGHSPVHAHEDLAGIVTQWGFRTLAHPWIFRIRPEVAVMVSGNAMAHVYVHLESRTRLYWPDFPARYKELVDRLLGRESVDLAVLPTRDGALVRSSRGDARVIAGDKGLSYHQVSGDPLRIGGDLDVVTVDESYEATLGTDYPDSVAQIAAIAMSPRSGEIILSAAREWDFRSRYEPIPHVSSHGALHREHMMVPLLMNRTYGRTPRRTTDVFPTAMELLGHPVPSGLDGVSFT